MNAGLLFATVIVAAMLALQGYATVRLMRCRAFSRVQKAGQAKLVWLLPLLGAAFVLVMVLEEDRNAGQWSSASANSETAAKKV